MKINDKEIKGIIFDLDGTLFDSCEMWHQVDEDFFKKRAMEMPADYSASIAHLGLKKAASYTKERFNLAQAEEEIIKEWNDAAIYQYTNNVGLKPYVVNYLEYLKENGIKLGVATANSSEYYMPCLKKNNIDHFFDYICDVSKFKGSKESPEIYLFTAKKLGLSVDECAVFEDIVQALKTAHDAGFYTVAVDDKTQQADIEAKKINSDLFIKSYCELLK